MKTYAVYTCGGELFTDAEEAKDASHGGMSPVFSHQITPLRIKKLAFVVLRDELDAANDADPAKYDEPELETDSTTLLPP